MKNQPLTGYPSIDKPWLKYYSEDVIRYQLPECTIYEYLWEENKDHLNDVAIVYFGRKITFGELFKNIDACQRALKALGVKENEIVTVALPSIPEALYLVYAIDRLGAISNMIHPLAGENEICNYLNEVSSRVCFLFTGTYEMVKNSLGKTSVEKAVVVSAADSLPFGVKQLYKLKTKGPKLPRDGLALDWRTFLQGGKAVSVAPAKRNVNETALISHTGGTTGVPKGVMCSDIGINTVIWEMGCNLPHKRQEITLVVLPPFINYSLVNSMMAPLAMGFQIILIPDYKPELFGKYIEQYRPNHVSSIPAYWEALLHTEESKRLDLSCLHLSVYGGEGMDRQTEEKINELLLSCKAPSKLAKGFGATEVVSAATIAFQETNLLDSVGIPLAKLNCKIVDPETLEECTYDQVGEVCFSGPQIMLGYYNDQAATDEMIKVHSDGERWLHMGDLGHLTKDGVLFLDGRIKRIVMTKGKDGAVTKMFPDRIEKVILQHPDVDLCCVVGVPDQARIHYAKAVVVLRDSRLGSEELTASILALCKEQLPGYMVPEEVTYLPDLPRTERGKVDYRALEQEAWLARYGENPRQAL